MVGGSWFNNDGLYLQYGTQKAVPTVTGDYLSYGEWRDIELTLNLAALTTTPLIIGNTTFLGTNIFIESVNYDTEVAGVGGTSYSVGTMRADRATVISNSNLLSANTTFTAGSSATINTGGIVGTTVTTSTFPDNFAYITAIAAGTFSAGTVKIRIRYRGIGTITQ
jgi:hypothetical protein